MTEAPPYAAIAEKLRLYERDSREWWCGRYRVGSLTYSATTCRLKSGSIAIGFSMPCAPSFIFVSPDEARGVFSLGDKLDALTCLGLDRRLRAYVEQEIRERRL